MVENMNVNRFADLMAGMLKELKIPPPLSLQSDSCTLHFDEHPDMHFLNRIPQYLDIVTDASALNKVVSNDKLFDLLELNGLDAQYLACAVTVHRASGTVVVLCREQIEHLDLQMLLKMKQSVHAKVLDVKRIVNQTDSHAKPKSATTSARMKNLVQLNCLEK